MHFDLSQRVSQIVGGQVAKQIQAPAITCFPPLLAAALPSPEDRSRTDEE